MEEQNQDTPFLSHSIMNPKVLLIYGKSNIHLGLWKDLEDDNRVILRTTELRHKTKVKTFVRKVFNKIDKHVYLSSFKHLFYGYHDIFKIISSVEHLVIIDGALNVVNISELRKCKSLNPNLKISLYLINSIKAQSPIMRGVRPKIGKFKWDTVYTFDREDAEQYGYKWLGFNYYSRHKVTDDEELSSDAFFVGGLKGGRADLIYDVYSHLTANGITSDFYLMPIGNAERRTLDGIYYYRGWRPYEEILTHVQRTKCIVEIMQEGQSGATLRYFEAVCMNKKLLTNNPSIVEFPFYNPKWMRIFTSVNDIDIDWLKSDDAVDYGYQGEFSPVHFIDYFIAVH